MATKSGPAGQRTKTRRLKTEHPYTNFEGSPLWDVIDSAISDLVENSDIRETTHRRYIVGYLCKKITDSKFAKK